MTTYRTFTNRAAQGEITLVRIADYSPGAAHPEWSVPLMPEGGAVVVGHSETGHHHVMSADSVDAAVLAEAPAGMRILNLIVASPTPLIHLRPYDTHEPVMVDPGVYRAMILREYDPYQELARQQAD